MTKVSKFPPELGRLAAMSRVRLFSGRTPIQALPNLAKHLSTGANLFVKRDDCTELAFGGNKVRQLEFYLGEAVAQDADTILITGAVQSNFVRLAAAGATKLGMSCHIQLEERVAKDDPIYHTSGNVLLDRLLGATLHSYPDGEDEEGADRQLRQLADQLREAGKRPYIIPLAPGHPPLGALGYVVAAHEILQQIEEDDLAINEIVVASGSGNTHGGLLSGLKALGSAIKVTGICVRRDADNQRLRLLNRSREIADLLGIQSKVTGDDIVLSDEFLAPGYGISSDACMRAILIGARYEALMLDPTYTGKSMAGFIQRAKEAKDNKGLLFIHTGGLPEIFAYQDDISRAVDGAADNTVQSD
jgi:D-cysteine desulfhydrase family pyridoxal phosphate-dependent enzyme